jgi:hypothetical protein
MLKEETFCENLTRPAGKLKEERTVEKPVGDRRRGPLVQEEKGCWSNNRRNIGATRRKPLQPEDGSWYLIVTFR